MILCHKCSGTFSSVEGLNGCQCISGYPRGFEVDHPTVEAAATQQVKAELEWISLYVSQGRPIGDIYSRLPRLVLAMKTSQTCGHGHIKWDELAKTTE